MITTILMKPIKRVSSSDLDCWIILWSLSHYHFVKPCQPLCFEKFSVILIKPVRRVSLAAAARALSDQFVTIMSTLIWLKKIELCLTLMMGGWMSRFGIPIHDSWSRSCSTRACLYIYEHSRALCACALHTVLRELYKVKKSVLVLE